MKKLIVILKRISKLDGIELALIYGFIVPILIVLLLIVVARSNDDRVKEETRRSEMYKYIGDEEF